MPADLISVIVPMFNCEDRILRCVDSILNQTYKNIRLIVIDDGSTDNSLEVLKSGVNDSRITILHQDNHGASYTRNQGIKLALTSNPRSDWITFVDADDYIDPNTFEDCLNHKDLSSFDMIHYGYRKTDETDNEIRNFCDYKDFVISQCEAFQNVMDGRISEERIKGNWLILMTSALLRTEIIGTNGLLFNIDLKLGEDYLFAVQYLSHCKKIRMLSKPYYTWWTKEGSLSSYGKGKTDRQITICKILWPMMYEIIQPFNHELDETYASWIISHFNYLSKLSAMENLDYKGIKRWYTSFSERQWIIDFINSQKLSNFNERCTRVMINLKTPIIGFLFVKTLEMLKLFGKL